MNSTPEISQQPTQTSRDEALRVLQKCHAGDIDDFLSEIRQKKTTDEPSTNMSDTPETDAAVIPPNGPSSSGTVPADLCRHMERERNSLIDQRDCAITIHKSHLASSHIQTSILAEKHNEMLHSRNQWRECAEERKKAWYEIQSAFERSRDEVNTLERERDQWRECAERLAVNIAWSPLVPTKSIEAALAEFERLKGETK